MTQVAPTSDRAAQLLGHARIAPAAPVVAGAVGTWTLTYTVGALGIDEGGTIKIARRFASDWQPPQLDRPADAGYTTIHTTGAAKLAARYDRKGHHRPWMKCLVLDVYDGSLAPGDTVSVVLGDRGGGSPGIGAQSFQETRHEVRVYADPTNACQPALVPDPPVLRIVAGEPVRLRVTLPAQGAVGEAMPIHVRGEDRWGNPTDAPPGVSLRWEGDADAAIRGGALRGGSAGVGRVIAEHEGETYPSNPTTFYPPAHPPALRRFWGDLHAQSDATVGTGTEEQYFTFGRDAARLDFISHQGNDFQMTDADWDRLNDATRRFHEAGRFVVFPGYEWSANTTAGGDRNVFYLQEGMPIYRSSAWQIGSGEARDMSATVPVTVLFDRLRALDTDKVLCGAHVGGRYADIARGFDDRLGPLVEVVSCWGVFEWLLWDALERGHVVGVMCNSDGHKGRPGAEGPGAGDFGIAGGLTCALARSLTREAVFDALKQRRCYGTTGARMRLDFTVGGRPMGSVIPQVGAPLHAHAEVVGCGPIERLELRRGREIVKVARPRSFADLASSRRVRVAWQGSRIRGRGRRVTWDGELRAEGARILEARPYSFDSPNNGITRTTAHAARFTSATTGDADGVDLLLDDASSGRLTLDAAAGAWSVDLAQLGDQPVSQAMGGIDMAVWAQRYPEAPRAVALSLDADLPAPGETREPWLVKAVQCDGHTAWSSPVYLQRGD